jgi:hypothetical protein
MTIFRHKKTRVLYTIEYVKPMMYTGSWHEATPLWGGKVKKNVSLKDYEVVSER